MARLLISFSLLSALLSTPTKAEMPPYYGPTAPPQTTPSYPMPGVTVTPPGATNPMAAGSGSTPPGPLTPAAMPPATPPVLIPTLNDVFTISTVAVDSSDVFFSVSLLAGVMGGVTSNISCLMCAALQLSPAYLTMGIQCQAQGPQCMASPPRAPLSFEGIDADFTFAKFEVAGNTGGELLKNYFEKAAPDARCPAGSIGCTKLDIDPGAVTNGKYHVQLGDPYLNGNGQVRFPVEDVYLTGDSAQDNEFDCGDSCGYTHVNWVSGANRDRVWQTFLALHPASAPQRLRAFDNFMNYVIWHEKQHERHLKAAAGEILDVVNDPLIPADVSTVEEATRLVIQDRDRRNAVSTGTLANCTKEFHGRAVATAGNTTNRFEDVMTRCIFKGDCGLANQVDACLQGGSCVGLPPGSNYKDTMNGAQCPW